MLENHELLDRFELLFPFNMQIADLRRAYVDKDMSSIFRLIASNNVAGDVEDLRKAVMEQNLHSLFRLVDNDDLRKFILEDNTWKMWPLLENMVDTQFVNSFKNFQVNDTNIDVDCFSRGQLQSKLWLVKELSKINVKLGTVFLCAGWYATLSTMIFESGMSVKCIRSFDIDPTCVSIAEVFNKPWFMDQWKFKAITQDIFDINYSEHTWQFWSNANKRMSKPITDTPDTIINTSTEHIRDYTNWYNLIPNGKLIILQGNNYFEIPEHVNCSKNLLEFSDKSPMEKVLYQGEINLPKYTRFMKIGIK